MPIIVEKDDVHENVHESLGEDRGRKDIEIELEEPSEESRALTSHMVNIWRKSNLLDLVQMDLEERVKHDNPTKLSVFFCGLSKDLREPTNLFVRGESGIGKTYNTVQTLRYFPEEDVWNLGGLSPKAIIHDYGVLLNEHGEEIDADDWPIKPHKSDFPDNEAFLEAMNTYKERRKAKKEEMAKSYKLIDLRGKILVFLESPSIETFRMLRPILSHDKQEVTYKYVDSSRRGMPTMKVVLKNWPATIFLTTDMPYVEELATRGFTVSPQTDELKIIEGNSLINRKDALPWKYRVESAIFKEIKGLMKSLKNQTENSELDVIIPFLNLSDLFPHQIVRDMRDFQHFSQLVKTVAFLHYFQRPQLEIDGQHYLTASIDDVKTALALYKEIFETTRTGAEQRILDFYHKIVRVKTFCDEKGDPVKNDDGTLEIDDKPMWYLDGLTESYNKTAKKKVSSDTVRRWLRRLDEIGYVDTRKDSTDKRKDLFVPLISEKQENQRKLDMQQDLKPKLEKGFEMWKENLCSNYAFAYMKNIDATRPDSWGIANITLEEFSKLVLGENIFVSSKPNVLQSISKEENKPIQQTNPKDSCKAENQQIATNPQDATLIPCPECKAKGKSMLFCSDADLRAHVSACHESQD